MTRGAVIVGAHVNALGVIRALAKHEVPAVVIATRPFDIAHRSRWVSAWHRLPQVHEDHSALIDLLERHASRWQGWTVFPTHDDALTALARHHERLSRWYRLAAAPWDAIADLVDKDCMHALAASAGLDVPVCYGAATRELAHRPDLRFPVVVKPLQHDRLINARGGKVFLAADRPSLVSAIDTLERLGVPGLAFEFIDGSDRDIFVYGLYMHRGGEPSPGVTIRKIRQNPPVIGSARVAEVVDEIPELREATVALLRRAEYHGLAFAEFKRDAASGRFRFVEVNARPVLFNAILPPTGIDLVAAAWADLSCNRRPELRRTSWAGTWIHEQADVLWSWRRRGSESIGFREFAAPYRRPHVFAVWSASDPGPFVEQTMLSARRAWRAAVSGW